MRMDVNIANLIVDCQSKLRDGLVSEDIIKVKCLWINSSDHFWKYHNMSLRGFVILNPVPDPNMFIQAFIKPALFCSRRNQVFCKTPLLFMFSRMFNIFQLLGDFPGWKFQPVKSLEDFG